VVDFVSSISTLANLTSAPLLTTTGTITTGGAAGAGFSLNLGTVTYIGTLRNAAFGAAYTIPFPITSGGTGTTNPALVQGAGISITGSWPNNTIAATTGAAVNYTPSNPPGVTSTTTIMLGLGSTLKVTPTKTGNVLLIVSGQNNNSTSGGSCTMQVVYGTGAAPSNGAGYTGTPVNAFVSNAPGANGSTSYMEYSVSGAALGLTLGTQYWWDLAVNVQAGSTCFWLNTSATAFEQ
jgi:hypothetical protein